MRLFRQYLVLLLLLATLPLSAATVAENHAFKTAAKLYSDKLFVPAEKGFADFVEKYATADRRDEAILFEAKARFYQSNYDGTIDLLRKEQAQAGKFGDEYQYWIAESLFHKGDFTNAANSYAVLCKNFPQSPLRLEACYSQAFSFSKLQNRAQVIALLGKADGDFQVAAKAQPDSDFAINGFLLLAQALVDQQRWNEAEDTVNRINSSKLNPEAQWRKEFLSAKVDLAQGQLQNALESSTNTLPKLAVAAGQRRFTAESVFLEAQIYEKLSDRTNAVEAYDKALAEPLPDELRRQALFKAVELSPTSDAATKRLQAFIQQNPRDPVLDLALVRLGELQLKEYFSELNNAVATNIERADTNLVQLAFTNFETLRTNYPQTEYVGKASLYRGWCLWVTKRFDEAQQAFADAVIHLPVSEDQAIARFKLADCQFAHRDFTNAITNYAAVARDYGQFENVKSAIVDQALYQLLRASVETKNESVAADAVNRIVTLYPNSLFGDRGLLLLGQDLNHQSKPSDAREVLERLVKTFPNSALRPQAELAIAQTYVLEKKWPNAIGQLKNWEDRFSTNTMLPDAEFSLGLAYAQAGMETNAFNLFTNFVARFATNQLAARAQNWIGDYYFNQEKYVEAEQSYQVVYQKYTPRIELGCQAKLMAGRSAFERHGRDDLEAASKYFLEIINDTNTPALVRAETYFALGDTLHEQFIVNTNRSEDTLHYAIKALQAKEISTNAQFAARALGRIGDYHLSWAMMRTNLDEFAAAKDSYDAALNSEFCDDACRTQTECKLGLLYEKQGDSGKALDQYLKLVYEDDGKADPYFVKEAGIAAGKLLEGQQQWEQAANVYKRLIKMLPPLQPVLEKKINALQAEMNRLQK